MITFVENVDWESLLNSSVSIRKHLISRSDVPKEVLLRLAADEEVSVRATLANSSNPAVDAEVLGAIVFGDNPANLYGHEYEAFVVTHLIENPRTPLQTLLKIASLNPPFFNDASEEEEWHWIQVDIEEQILDHHMDEVRELLEKQFGYSLETFPDSWVWKTFKKG